MTLGNSKQNGCNIAQKAKTKFNSKNLGMWRRAAGNRKQETQLLLR